jgi:hypothetical protein
MISVMLLNMTQKINKMEMILKIHKFNMKVLRKCLSRTFQRANLKDSQQYN